MSTTPPAGLPHKYRLCGIGYCKALAIKLGIKHRTVNGYLFTAKAL